MKLTQIICIIIFSAMTFACSKPAHTIRVKPTGEDVVVSKSPQARASFRKAVVLLQKAQYEESIVAFKNVRAEYPDDPVAPASELYLARAAMGSILVKSDGSWVSTTKPDQLNYAAKLFTTIAQDSSKNVQLRYAAMLYGAMAHTILGQGSKALSQLKTYPGGTLSGLILKADRVAALRVLVESLIQNKRYKAALIATASLRSVREANNVANKFAGRDVIMAFATSKAFELASSHVDKKALHMEFVVSKDSLLQASAGTALIHQMAKNNPDEAQRKLIDDLYNRTSTALVSLGLVTRAAELSQVMVSIGDNRKLVVGALLPLSGNRQMIGRRVMRGLLLAQQAYTSNASGAKMTLVFEDANKPAKESVESLKKQGALAIIGPLDKKLIATYRAQAVANKIPIVMLTTQGFIHNPSIKKEDAYLFRHFIDARAEARTMANLSATRFKNKRVAVVAPKSAYGKVMADSFVAAMNVHKLKPVIQITYDPKKNDYSTIARKVARAKPDAIFLPDTSDKVSQLSAFLAKENVWGRAPGIISKKRKRRIWVNYLGTSVWKDNRLLQQAATYINGASIPAWYSGTSGGAKSKAFANAYTSVFASEPSIYEAFAYDVMMWFRQLTLTQGLRRPQALRDALVRSTGFDGVTGHARFYLWGEPDKKLRVILVKSKGFIGTPWTQTILANPIAPKP